jgi:hypothetical protein
VRPLGVPPFFLVNLGQPLELQLCDDASPAQRFAFDGDAILMGSQSAGRVSREFIIEPQLKYTPSRTPLVVGTREFSDAEYFRFEAADHSSAFPTTGFIRVSSEVWLDWALSLGWGIVIEIDAAQPLELKGPSPNGSTPALRFAVTASTLITDRRYTPAPCCPWIPPTPTPQAFPPS